MGNNDDNLKGNFLDLGQFFYDQGDTDRAIILLKKAVAENSNGRDEHIALARAFFRRGNYELGIEHFDWIWNSVFPHQIGIFENKDLSGLKILLSADAALGDTIQLCRYSKLLMQQGAFVILEVQSSLVKLMQHSSIANEVISAGELPFQFDLRIPLHNLIGAFNSKINTIPNYTAYLKCNKNESSFSDKLINTSKKFQVGVCWCGHPDRPFDTRRSIPYTIFSSIFDTKDVDFFSLQLNNIPSDFSGVNLASHLNDCHDTAVLINQMNLVITVDSMIAHLASALGKPVILLNRLGGCWRWIDNSFYSPWYPNMIVLTQTVYDDWEPVVAKTVELLTQSMQQGKAAWL